MILVINELSYSYTESEGQSKSWYDDFFDMCIEIEKNYKCKLRLKYSLSLQQHNFNESYIFLRWLSSQNREQKTSILSMLTKETFIHDYPYYKAYDAEGKGLGYAYENDELLISFKTSENWTNHYIPVVQEQIAEETLEIEKDEFNLRNFFSKEYLDEHNKYVIIKLEAELNNVFNEVKNGVDIWTKKDDLFPNLIFCDSTEQFIAGASGSIFKNILKKFKEYDIYFSNWNNGEFEKDSLSGDVRLESETRINDFNNRLTITCPDGQNKLFSLHSNIGIWGYRMHFFPDTNTRKCIIGYVGKKIT
jgi:hypothetical protein